MPNTLVRNIMSTNLKTIHFHDSLETAFQRLQENGIRHLPVVNDHSHVVGILSDRDLLRANVATTEGRLAFPPAATVVDFMSTALKTVSITNDLQDAVNLMLNEKVSSCLIEKNGEIIGIVTYEDLIRLLKDYLKSPGGSVRSALAHFVSTSPLGPMSLLLAKVAM